MPLMLSKSEIGKMLRFLLVGLAATLVDLFVTFICLTVIGVDNYLAAVSSIFGDSSLGEVLKVSFEEVVSVVAFGIAFFVSFFGHSSFSFHKKRNLSVLLRLLTVNVGALLLRVLIIYLIKILLGLNGYVPVVTAMVIVTAISYVLSRFWVFNKAQDLAPKAN